MNLGLQLGTVGKLWVGVFSSLILPTNSSRLSPLPAFDRDAVLVFQNETEAGLEVENVLA